MWLMFFITLCFTIYSFIPKHKIDNWLSNGHNNNGKKDEKEEDKGEEKEIEEKEQTESVV